MLDAKLEFLRSVADRSYPFKDRSAPQVLRALVADGAIVIKKLSDAVVTNSAATVTMTAFTRTGTTINCTIAGIDTTTLPAPVSQVWGVWRVIQWRAPTSSITLVLNNTKLTDTGDPDYLPDPYVYSGDPILMGFHNVQWLPAQVSEVTVVWSPIQAEDGTTTTPDPDVITTATQPLRFMQQGHNVLITADANVTRDLLGAVTSEDGNRLTIDCSSGQGLGRFRTCGNVAGQAFVVNGITPDAEGNIVLDTRDCYRLEAAVEFEDPLHIDNPDSGYVLQGTLKLINSCKSCSECSDYANSYKSLRRIYTRLQALQGRSSTALAYYKYLQRLTEVLRDYLERPEVLFYVTQNQDNVYTITVQVKTGTQAFNRVQFSAAASSGYTYNYLAYSGWQQIANYPPQQVDGLFTPTEGMTWTVDQTLPQNTISQFWWVIKVVPNPDPGAYVVQSTNTLSINGTVTLRQLLPGGGTASHTFGAFNRSVTIKYPTRPLAYGPAREP